MVRSMSRTDLDRVRAEVHNMISRGVITDVDDGKLMQSLGIKLQNGHRPTKVEHWHPYGMTYHPHTDAEVLAFALNGDRDHIVVLPGADRRYRLKNLAQGEFAVHDDQGQKVHFTRDAVVVESAKGIVLKGPVRIEGNITHIGNMTTSGIHTDTNGPHTA